MTESPAPPTSQPAPPGSSTGASTSFSIGPAIGAALSLVGASSAHRPASPANSSGSGSGTPTSLLKRSQIPTTRSRGQLARRNSTNLTQSQKPTQAQLAGQRISSSPSTATLRSIDDVGRRSRDTAVADRLDRNQRASSLASRSHSRSPSRRHDSSNSEGPLLGGLYFSDLVVVAFFYAFNLIRTVGLAELGDVLLKGLAWGVMSLPQEFWRRWSLSTKSKLAPGLYQHMHPATNQTKAPAAQRSPDAMAMGTSQSPSLPAAQPATAENPAPGNQGGLLSPFSSGAASQAQSADDSIDLLFADQDGQRTLSPFHHLIILLTRFACSNFPHLLPRVLFAEDTIGPLVRWRTGGGAAGLVREFGSDPLAERRRIGQRPSEAPTASSTSAGAKSESTKPGSFRAFWIGTDAHVPPQVRRERERPDAHRPPGASERIPTTVLYLHGGGFSLGSVAFYAEALIRMLGKICVLEQAASARCIAVEYDLAPAPSARFPAPLLQCLRCYAHLIEVEGIPAESITIAGDSAGANIAMCLLLCLNGGKDIVAAASEPGVDIWAERSWSELPMPGQAVLISPWADLRPQKALTFAKLRAGSDQGAHAGGNPEQADLTGTATPKGSPSDSKLRQAISEFEWDYVLPETLLHFAQVYTGVLEVPRRVRGPIGWISHVCGKAAAALEKVDGEAPIKRVRGDAEAREALGQTLPLTQQMMDVLGISSALGACIRLPRNLVLRLKQALDEPLLGLGPGSDEQDAGRATGAASGGAGTIIPANAGQVIASNHQPTTAKHGLAPLFPSQERKTDVVASTHNLFVPFQETYAEHDQHSGKSSSSTRKQAAHLLETSPLVSPAIADWSSIRLQRGILVTWGERERLSADIELWVERLREAYSKVGDTDMGTGEAERANSPVKPEIVSAKISGGFSLPTDLSPEQSSQPSSTNWLRVAVEHGPGGVHAWPFVSMYLAGTEAEREKGLELLARFIAQEPLAAATMDPQDTSESGTEDSAIVHDRLDDTPDSYTSSAGSMPSDSAPYGEETDETWYGSGAGEGMRTTERSDRSSQPQTDYFQPRRGTRRSPMGPATDSSEGSSSPEGRVTSLGRTTSHESIGLGIGPLPPPLPIRSAPTPNSASPYLGGGASIAQSQAGQAAMPRYVQGYGGFAYPVSSVGGVSYPYTYRSVSAPCYVEEAARRAEAERQARAQSTTTIQPATTGLSVSTSSSAQPARSDEASDADAEASNEDRDDRESLDPDAQSTEEDDEEDGSNPTSPSTHSALFSQQYPWTLAALPSQGTDPSQLGFYGFSHFTGPREPEGLSDITEEGSVLSASVTSGGGRRASDTGEWMPSSSASSPAQSGFASLRNAPGATHLSFGTGFVPPPTIASVTAGQSGYLTRGLSQPMDHSESFEGVTSDAIEEEPDDEEEGVSFSDDNNGIDIRSSAGDISPDARTISEAVESTPRFAGQPIDASPSMAFSPPAGSQPGPRLRTMGSSSSLNTTTSAGSDGRKKPKGDVWW
ncbi:hypothetical protein OC845_003887 [Tilletia horrida]|nr:hypothetical protein OC845_003887 [Tilletia horrida]